MSNNNFNIADILQTALKGILDADVIDVTPIKTTDHTDAERKGCFYTASMPVKAIFNVKTEETIPVLDENGKPIYDELPTGEKYMVKKTIKLEHPVLASKVFFEDGTWTVVKNTGEDSIDLVEVKLPNGQKVITASDASKERALAYAIVKHAFGKADPKTREVKNANLGRRFDKILKASIDQRICSAMSKSKQKKAAKVKRQEIKQTESETKAKKSINKKPVIDIEPAIITKLFGENKISDIDKKEIANMVQNAMPDIMKLAKEIVNNNVKNINS